MNALSKLGLIIITVVYVILGLRWLFVGEGVDMMTISILLSLSASLGWLAYSSEERPEM